MSKASELAQISRLSLNRKAKGGKSISQKEETPDPVLVLTLGRLEVNLESTFRHATNARLTLTAASRTEAHQDLEGRLRGPCSHSLHPVHQSPPGPLCRRGGKGLDAATALVWEGRESSFGLTLLTGCRLLPRGWHRVRQRSLPGREQSWVFMVQRWFMPALPCSFCAGSSTAALPGGPWRSHRSGNKEGDLLPH